MTPLLAAILGYVAAQLAVGVWVSRRIRTEADYLLAGRRLGPGLATASLFATWFGAETCIGAAGTVYGGGLRGATAEPFGYALCLLLMGLVFARVLWSRQYVTLADLFRDRYSRGVETLAVLMMVPTSILWGAAQIRAFGQVLSASSDLGLSLGMAIAAAVVIVYTTSGGLLADAITDVFQGALLALGLLVLLVVVVGDAGGVAGAAAMLRAPHPSAPGPSPAPLDLAEAWLVPVLGSVTANELAARVLASRSPGVARGSSLAAGGLYLLVGLVPVTLGLLAARTMPGLADGETVLPALAQRHLPPLLHVVFAGALVSAILSTVDSNLLSASSLVAHNVVLRAVPNATESRRLRINRVGVVAAGLLAWGIARSSESVFALVEDASAFGGAGFFVVMVLGLFTRFGGTASAWAALLSGMAVQIVGTYVLDARAPYTASLLVSLLAYALVGLWERGRVRRAA